MLVILLLIIFCGMTANLMKGEGTLLGTIRLEKHSRWNVQNGQSNNNREAELEDNGGNNHGIQANDDRPKRGRMVFTNVLSAEKVLDCFGVHIWC